MEVRKLSPKQTVTQYALQVEKKYQELDKLFNANEFFSKAFRGKKEVTYMEVMAMLNEMYPEAYNVVNGMNREEVCDYFSTFGHNYRTQVDVNYFIGV